MSKDVFLSPGHRYNCPNCAAPLTGESVCQYCGTRIEWIPVISCNLTMLPKKFVPVKAEFRLDRHKYETVERGKYVEFCIESLKHEICSYATRFVKIGKTFDPVLNTLVYRGELLVCEPKDGGDAE